MSVQGRRPPADAAARSGRGQSLEGALDDEFAEELVEGASALRNTFNRMLGCLHHCLQKGVLYNENEEVAFRPREAATA
ncbi:hypothetical protein [Nonomuraea sp. bgisy101]|uniref:hypothetical protein n=1 Tax=Nonomuraea sp. bgisy101 TaxID=3413784 RepID=UPI003D707838